MLVEDASARSVTFEGWYQLLTHTRGYQSHEWASAEPWNPATSLTLAPGGTCRFQIRVLFWKPNLTNNYPMQTQSLGPTISASRSLPR